MRRVGVELEFAGLGIAQVSTLVENHVGGRRVIVGDYGHRVRGHRHGDWHVEFDLALLKQWGRRVEVERVDELLEQLVRVGAEPFVPMEVVSPPLPMDEVEQIDGCARPVRAARAMAWRMHSECTSIPSCRHWTPSRWRAT
jgi:Putative amidoligase enzyme